MEKHIPLKIEGLSLNFGGIQALDSVGFELRPAEILGLVGPNGAGKTCVLNVISGIYRPSKGKVLFEGKDVVGLRSHKIAVLGMARTFQNVELFTNMTVLENLLLGCHTAIKTNLFSAGIFWGLAQKDECNIRYRVEEVIEFLELEMFRKFPAAGLPLGVRKLVGLGRALVMKPKVLLLDEPSSGMTRQEKEDFARFLLRIKYELGVPMLWVEHDMKLIGDLADRLVVLHYGRKVTEGTLAEVISNPQVIEAYLGKSHAGAA